MADAVVVLVAGEPAPAVPAAESVVVAAAVVTATAVAVVAAVSPAGAEPELGRVAVQVEGWTGWSVIGPGRLGDELPEFACVVE